MKPFIKDFVEKYITQERAYHASNNVAKSLIVFEKVISRDRLRPSFGKGKMSGGMADNINPKLGGDG